MQVVLALPFQELRAAGSRQKQEGDHAPLLVEPRGICSDRAELIIQS